MYFSQNHTGYYDIYYIIEVIKLHYKRIKSWEDLVYTNFDMMLRNFSWGGYWFLRGVWM